MIRSPIRWVGGKSRIRKKIISIIPEHDCFVEVFSGAAWVLLGKDPSSVEVLNDIDDELINFFQIIKNRPNDLIESFEWELCSRSRFEELKHTDPSTLNSLERAHRFYYLIMASWGGEIYKARFQTSVNDRGNGNRLINAVKKIRRRIRPVYERLRNVIIESLDWRECIEKYDKEGVVMYLDPPYPNNSCNYKHDMKKWNEHEKISQTVSDMKSKVIITYKNTDRIKDEYSDFHVEGVDFQSGMPSNGNRRNKEIIITNFKVT